MQKPNKPKTLYSDFIEYKKERAGQFNQYFAKLSAGLDQESLWEHCKSRLLQIEEDFKELLHPEDIYNFADLPSARDFLIEAGFEESRIEEVILHEWQHSWAAAERSYRVKGYECFLLVLDDGSDSYSLSTRLEFDPDMTIDDYVDMMSAPDRLSVIDKASLPVRKKDD